GPLAPQTANAQFSVATLAEMMDCAPQLALRAGDQLKSAAQADQDRHQRPQLQPVQQQANGFKAHFSSSCRRRIGSWVSNAGATPSKPAATEFNQMSVKTLPGQRQQGVFRCSF